MEYLYGYEMIPSEDIADYFTDAQKYVMLPWEDRMGMKVTSGVVTLEKDHQNLVGVSIGGGAPNCPCIYIVQIFDNTPASRDGTLAAGDEIVGINGVTAKCRTKSEVARMIQMSTERVSINYNKLHADPKQGKTLDLVLKKVKHRVVESMTSGTADALGLSRAILCNDSMVKKLEELEKTEVLYRNLALKTKGFLKAFFDLSRAHRAFGDVFSGIGVREPLAQASLVFSKFGDTHRELEKNALNLIKVIKPMMSDLSTYLCKAIPDTKLTIKKYLDSKFEYLSYCLKVKEMDDEEYACNTLNEYLYRVETGNYEYRLVLRCRQEARSKFAKMRNDVLVKLELLDNKRVQDMVFQLQRFVTSLARCHADNHGIMKDNQLFPIEVDLSRGIFDYNTTGRMPADEDRCDEDEVSSVDTSPGFISTIKEEAEERPSVERDDELVEIGNDEFSRSLLLDSGDQEDSPKLEKDLFDFFLDSQIGLSANSSISSILKKSSEQHSKVPLESDFNPFESLEEKVALFRGKEGVQGFSGWFGDASDTNNNSNAAVQDSPRNCYKDKEHKLPGAKGDDALESSNLGDPTSDRHIHGKIEGVDSNNNGGLEAGDDLDEDFFFEAISSRFPSEEFIKDFMVGTRTSEIGKGDVSDKDDNDDKMLEFEEDDKILTDAGNPSNDVSHPPAIDRDEASKDDALIEDAGVRGRSRSAEIQSDDDALLVCVDSP